MSRFIDAVQAKMTHERKALTQVMPLLEVDETLKPMPMQDLTSYEVSVQWIRRGHCRPADLHQLKRNIIHELRNAVYGELVQHCISLERAVYENDYKGTLESIDAIMKEVRGQ